MNARVKVVIMVNLEDQPVGWSSHHAGVSTVIDVPSAKFLHEALDRNMHQAFKGLSIERVAGDYVPDLSLAHGGSPEDPDAIRCKCGHRRGQHGGFRLACGDCGVEVCEAFEASKEYAR